jgi:hypothetical protein
MQTFKGGSQRSEAKTSDVSFFSISLRVLRAKPEPKNRLAQRPQRLLPIGPPELYAFGAANGKLTSDL